MEKRAIYDVDVETGVAPHRLLTDDGVVRVTTGKKKSQL